MVKIRSMKVNDWDVIDNNGSTKKENILDVLEFTLNNIPPQKIPQGLTNYRIMNKIDKALKNARETKVLELESQEYLFIKGLLPTMPVFYKLARDEMIESLDEFESLAPEEKE